MNNTELVQERPPRKTARKNNSEIGSLISEAIQNNLPVETMERLFSLREKIKAEQAKEAFVRALANFQSACPTVDKSKRVLNKDGSLRYMYAPLDSITNAIKALLAENGLSYTWDVKNTENMISVTTTITHELGHSQTSTFEVPMMKSEYMTAPQSYASALTFAKRYSLTNALGISTGDEDTDATDTKKSANPSSKKAQILHLLKRLKADVSTPENTLASVKRLTHLDLSEKTADEVIGRLEMKVNEMEHEG